MSGGDENDGAAGYATRASARTPTCRGLADANVNELAPPHSAAKLQDFKGR
jgi:hypothetical protein